MFEKILSIMSEKDWIILFVPIIFNILIDSVLLYFVKKSFERSLRRREKQEDYIAESRKKFSGILQNVDQNIVTFRLEIFGGERNKFESLGKARDYLLDAVRFYKMNQTSLLRFESDYYDLLSCWESYVVPVINQLAASDYSLLHVVQEIPPPNISTSAYLIIFIQFNAMIISKLPLWIFIQTIIDFVIFLLIMFPLARDLDKTYNTHFENRLIRALHKITKLAHWKGILSDFLRITARLGAIFNIASIRKKDGYPPSSDKLNNVLEIFDVRLTELINDIQSNLFA